MLNSDATFLTATRGCTTRNHSLSHSLLHCDIPTRARWTDTCIFIQSSSPPQIVRPGLWAQAHEMRYGPRNQGR